MEYVLVENIEYMHWNSSHLEKTQFQFTGVFDKGKYPLFKKVKNDFGPPAFLLFACCCKH